MVVRSLRAGRWNGWRRDAVAGVWRWLRALIDGLLGAWMLFGVADGVGGSTVDNKLYIC